MSPTIIYRLEHKRIKGHKTYVGPYAASGRTCSSIWADNKGHGDNAHPSPRRDRKLSLVIWDMKWEGKYHCGFKTLKELKKWFSPSERRRLSLQGFIITQYESNKIIDGDKQVLFIPKKKYKRKIIK